MVQTEEATLTHPATYIRGHKPTPSQESNTLSEVSCTTTLSSCSDRQEDLEIPEIVDGRDKVDLVRRVQGPLQVPAPRYCDTIVRDTSMDFDKIVIGTSRDSLLTLTGGDSCLDSYRRSVGSQDSAGSSVNSQGSVLRGEDQLFRGSSSIIHEVSQERDLKEEAKKAGRTVNSQENVKRKDLGLQAHGSIAVAKSKGVAGPEDAGAKESKGKGVGLSFRRNIHMNIDIDKSTNALDNSNTSEDPSTPLLLESEDDDNATPSKKPSHPPDSVSFSIPTGLSPSPLDIPEEPIKTFLSFIWLWSGFFATTTSLALTHEKVPDMAPLPDALLDNIEYQRWGLDLSEILLVVSSLLGAVVVMCHVHRLVILRRVWLMLGILYYYRAVTMFITVLPKPDESYTCAQKIEDITPYDITRRVITLLSGGGLSINGKHIYCGDYIFSGHTMTLTMGYLTIKQYSPRRFIVLHWISFLISLVGICSLVVARGHYSIDVLLAYFVTSRLWWIYHTMATNDNLKMSSDDNILSRAWWFYIFWYFERNVPCKLPRSYTFPVPSHVKRLWMSLRGCQLCKARGEDSELIEGDGKEKVEARCLA